MYSSNSWSCSKCTFINPISQPPICQICLTPQNPDSHSSRSQSQSQPKWSCKLCTFLNSPGVDVCEICGARALDSLLAEASAGSKRTFEDLLDKGLGDDSGSNATKLAKLDVVHLGKFRFLTYSFNLVFVFGCFFDQLTCEFMKLCNF